MARISIRAPAGGATHCKRQNLRHWIFQFAPLREGRLQRFAYLVELLQSQFAPLREGRLKSKRQSRISTVYFNSRPCGRGDIGITELDSIKYISIRAPAGGATRVPHRGRDLRLISIRAPAGGATALQQRVLGHVQFQFAPLREGRRRNRQSVQHSWLVFQFAPLREGRHWHYGA